MIISPRPGHVTRNHRPIPASALRLIVSSLLTLSLFALNGCSLSLKPASGVEHYYLLTGGSSKLSSPSDFHPCVVRLLPIEAPNFLQTRDMVVRAAPDEMVFATFHQWAEPLDAGVRRALADDLRTSPAVREVLTDEPDPGNTKVYVISIHIFDCEGNRTNGQNSILFEARWEISQSNVALAHGIFRAEPASWRSGDYGDLAIQLSRAIENLARLLNKTICSQPAISHSVPISGYGKDRG